ncbi:hypothetical protein UlMin_033431 [Ulmus minor]
MHRQGTPEFQLDHEIERTFRRLLRQNQGFTELGRMAALIGGNGGHDEHNEEPENRYVVVQPPNIIGIANDRDRSIRDYAIFDPEIMNTWIVRPEIIANHFEFKPMMFQMLQTVGQFSGLPHEDPHLHLKQFLEVASNFKIPGVSDDAFRLRLFPYSLKDRAKVWLNSLEPNSVTSWNGLAEKFLTKYFPPTKNARMRNDITCPHHGIPICIQMETFYNGLLPPTRLMLDASVGGALLNKSYAEAYELIESIHPNFSWSNQTGQSSNNPNRPINPNASAPPGFQQQQGQRPQFPTQSAPQKKGDSLESMMRAFMNKTETHIQNQGVDLRNLENQVVQLATALSSRPSGALPSNTESPQRDGNEHAKAITLRSGNTVEVPEARKRAQKESDLVQEEVITEQEKNQQENREVENSAEKSDADVSVVPQQTHQQLRPPPPFPQRFQKQQQDKKFQKFLDVLKQLHINIPFVEALEQMPNYVKFMKDMLMKKRRFGEFETVALTRECSAALQSKLPPKLQDPGSFTIPCSIGGRYCGKALCDLGASINLMPMSIFKTLGIGEARPTTVSLQLADRSIAQPEGKIEDVLVKVDKFIFPVDFIILDFEADMEVPIILGRPFLATGCALIDVHNGELTMRVQDEKVTFNVFQAMKFPNEVEECSALSLVDSLVSEKFVECCSSPMQSAVCENSNLEEQAEVECSWT